MRGTVTAILLAGALLLGGCATKKYVAKQVDPVKTKADQTEAQLGDTRKELEQTQSQLEATTEKASAADSRAGEAMSRADAASQKAEQVRNELRKELQDTFGSLDDYKVSGEATVQFKFNSAKLSDEAKQQLDQLAGQVGSMKRYFVAIQGFTDHIGSEDYNLTLSRQRAQAVQNYFVVQHNLPVYRIQIIGLGEQKPADEGRGRDARTKNRRVEVTVFTAGAPASASTQPSEETQKQ